MNKFKKSIILFIIFALILGISCVSKAENEIEETVPNTDGTHDDTEDDINDSLEDILSKYGIQSELNDAPEENSISDGNYFNISKNSIKLDSDIDGDAFIISAEKVTIDSRISGNAFICANEVEITDTAEVSASLFCVAKQTKIHGGININAYCTTVDFVLSESAHIYKNLYLTGNNITLDGYIQTNASISGQNITINPNCNIQGNLKYSAPNEIEFPETAVNGNVYFESNDVNITKRTFSDKISSSLKFIISYMIFATILFLILNGTKSRLIDASYFKSNIGKYVLFGLLILFVLPILNILILFVPILSILALVVLGIYILLLMLSSAITIITLSKFCADRYKESIKTNELSRTIIFISLFSIAYGLLKLVPVVQYLVMLTAVVLGIGIAIINVLPKKELD